MSENRTPGPSQLKEPILEILADGKTWQFMEIVEELAGRFNLTSAEALDFVGAVACRRALETGQSFLEYYLPAYNFRETERGTEYKRDSAFPILPPLWSRRDPDDDERDFPDVSETPDGGLPDLR